MGTAKATAGKTALVATAQQGAQAKGNYVTINIQNIRVLAGHVIDYKYNITEVDGNKIPIKYWDYNNKTVCRITVLDSQAYLVEYIYTDKDGGDVKARKVLLPGKDGTTFKCYEKDGYKNYVLETTYVNKYGVVTPNKRFSWATKLQ